MKKKLLYEKKKKKEYTYKNGLSITPFLKVKDNAGDVETGIENFNKNMSTGNLQTVAQGNTNSNVSMGLAEAVSASAAAINDAVNDLLNINGPQYRGAPYPPFDEFAINESEIPDNMRAKGFSIDNINTSYGKDEASIDCTWITQESFDEGDAEEFIEEFQRAIEAIFDKNIIDVTTEINIEIICRDGRDYGHHLDTIIYNGEKLGNNSINEDLLNEDNTEFINNIKNISDCIKKENKMKSKYLHEATEEEKNILNTAKYTLKDKYKKSLKEDLNSDFEKKLREPSTALWTSNKCSANAEALVADDAFDSTSSYNIDEFRDYFETDVLNLIDAKLTPEEITALMEELCEIYEWIVSMDQNERNEKADDLYNHFKSIKRSIKSSRKNMKEDLNNIVDVEEKSREVVDPGFASAVRSIRSNDKKRDELKRLRKAPKQGEESLPKDTKITLDESLFIESNLDNIKDVIQSFDDEDDINKDTFYGEDHIKEIKDTIRRYFTGNISTFIDTLLEEADLVDKLDNVLDVLDIIKEKIKLGD